MLLIHGVGMNADYWNNITDALEPHFSLTVVDMPGHGESPALATTLPELELYTDGIAATLDSPAIVTGHSMGALIALDMAVRYPQLTSGIAVCNGIYRRSEKATKAIRQRVAELLTDKQPDPTATLERWFGTSPEGEIKTVNDQCRQWLATMNQQSYAAAYHAFANADAPADEQLADIRCPALFITGELEPNSTPAMSHAMTRLVTNSRCIIIEQARHMMSLTHGTAVTNALVAHFKKG